MSKRQETKKGWFSKREVERIEAALAAYDKGSKDGPEKDGRFHASDTIRLHAGISREEESRADQGKG